MSPSQSGLWIISCGGTKESLAERYLAPFIHCMNEILKKGIEDKQRRIAFAGSVYHNDARSAKVTKVITAVLAPSLPVASTVLLYLMDKIIKRFTVAAGLAVFFSLTLSVVMDVRVVDIFAETAAYVFPFLAMSRKFPD
jgi:hypothetical protein